MSAPDLVPGMAWYWNMSEGALPKSYILLESASDVTAGI